MSTTEQLREKIIEILDLQVLTNGQLSPKDIEDFHSDWSNDVVDILALIQRENRAFALKMLEGFYPIPDNDPLAVHRFNELRDQFLAELTKEKHATS